jgi:hypothetical protein
MAMTEWTVTVAVADHGESPETMIDWEDRLRDFDASIARNRRGQLTFRLHMATDDLLKATSVAHDAIVERIGRIPVEIETVTEQEFYRRADEPTMPELMSAADIAEELGVKRQRVHQLRHTAAFPAPLAELGGGAVWDAAAVRHFAKNWSRKPGRPRSKVVAG